MDSHLGGFASGERDITPCKHLSTSIKMPLTKIPYILRTNIAGAFAFSLLILRHRFRASYLLMTKSFLLLASLLLCTLPARAVINIDLTFSPQLLSGSDFFGLQGSTFVFDIQVTEENYQAGGLSFLTQVEVPLEQISLTVSGSTSADGTYAMTASAGLTTTLQANIAGSGAAFFDVFGVGLSYQADNLFQIGRSGDSFNPSGSNVATPQRGDAIAASHFDGLVFSESGFTITPVNPSDPSGRFSFTNGIVTASAVVPEPSTYTALMGLTALIFVALRRRR